MKMILRAILLVLLSGSPAMAESVTLKGLLRPLDCPECARELLFKRSKEGVPTSLDARYILDAEGGPVEVYIDRDMKCGGAVEVTGTKTQRQCEPDVQCDSAAKIIVDDWRCLKQ
jgi:hypothetical protein